MRRPVLGATLSATLAVCFVAAAPAAAADPLGAEPAGTAVVVRPTPPAAHLGAVKHVWQTLNNCGPAAVVMALSTLGVDVDQETARLALRGADVRRGMGPQGVGPWVANSFGLHSTWRNNGTAALMKALVSNGFAPMVTQWMVDPHVQRTAHWRTVAGYDDGRGVFYVNDSMRGRDVALSYDWFDRNWQPFSYRWMVVYRPQDEPLLRAIVGDDWYDRSMRQRHYERARAEAFAQQDSAGWLALGEAAYQNGLFREAVGAFERGIALGSPQGVFTLRSSYPRALSALGRQDEAVRVQQLLSGITAVPATVAPAPDAFALQLAREREPAFDALRLSP